jgi:Protein of unknown function (DUF3105)
MALATLFNDRSGFSSLIRLETYGKSPHHRVTESLRMNLRMKPSFLILIGLALVFASCNKPEESVPLTGMKEFKYKGGDHKEGRLSYSETPPSGGAHNAAWQNCGVYDTQIAVENVIHSLEHGAVWITYRPDLDINEVTKIREYAKGQTYMLVSPYQYGALDKPIYVIAWNHSMSVDKADDKRIASFIKKYKNVADNTPEFGATCSGAIGTPIQ